MEGQPRHYLKCCHSFLLCDALKEYGSFLDNEEGDLIYEIGCEYLNHINENSGWELNIYEVMEKVSVAVLISALTYLSEFYSKKANDPETDDDTSADLSNDYVEIGCILRWMKDHDLIC